MPSTGPETSAVSAASYLSDGLISAAVACLGVSLYHDYLQMNGKQYLSKVHQKQSRKWMARSARFGLPACGLNLWLVAMGHKSIWKEQPSAEKSFEEVHEAQSHTTKTN